MKTECKIYHYEKKPMSLTSLGEIIIRSEGPIEHIGEYIYIVTDNKEYLVKGVDIISAVKKCTRDG